MKKFFKSGWFKCIVAVTVIVAGITLNGRFKEEPVKKYRTAFVSKGDIETVVEGSGAITSSESRKVFSKVSSEILEVLYEEGEEVKSGDVIAILDSSSYTATVDSQRIAIEQAKLSLNNIKKQISDLSIVANSTGFVSGLTVSEGSYVTNTMQICNVVDTNSFEVILPFVYNESNMVQVGNTAKVTLIQNFADLEGVVTKVSEMRKLSTGSSQVVDVTITVKTPGYSLAGASAKGEIIVNGTRQISTGIGVFNLVNSNIVRAKSAGTLKTLNVYEGKFVNAGDVIAVLSNDDLYTSLENANLTLKNLNNQYENVVEQLDNYTITAPIAGTITAQNLNVGDMVAVGTVLTTISNKEVLEFKVPIDELDIAKLSYDKEVKVSIDALEETLDNPIQGKITKLPLEGVSTAGVTEYFVTIQLPGSDDIRISMNANAEIITSSKQDVLKIPVDAVKKDNGESFVEVVLADGSLDKKAVELGIRNISYVEVKSGLNEGDEIVVPEVSGGIFPF